MNLLAIAQTASGSFHDATEGISAWGAFGAVIGLLVFALGTLVLLVRGNDLAMIKEAKVSLDKLVSVVESFRTDLSNLRIYLADNYTRIEDFREMENRLEKHIEHHIPRGERRRVEDAEA